MLKKVKKFLILPILLVSLFCVSLFSACGNDKDNDDQPQTTPVVNISANIKSAADGVISILTSQVYNNKQWIEGSKVYTVEEAQNTFKELNYYLEIGTLENFSDVTSIGFNGITFNKNDEFNISVGNNNFIKGKAYKYEKGKLYVAAPIIAFETVNGSKIKINDKDYDFNLGVSTSAISFTNVKWQTGSSNTLNAVEGKNNKEFNLNINNSKSWIEFYYEGASSNDVILTRKISNGKLQGYGLTKGETIEGNPLALYVVGWGTDLTTEANIEKYDGMVMNYKAYVLGKGISEVVLNVSVGND